MDKKIIIGTFLVVAAGVFVWVVTPKPVQEDKGASTATATPQPLRSPDGSETRAAAKLIVINDISVSPDTITVKQGEMVKFLNQGLVPHQINSDPHPTHTIYPPLNSIGLLKQGEGRSMTFPDKGTYKYHDHLNPKLVGVIIVE